MFQDLTYALRLWGRRPLPVAFAMAALAIGIGASSGVFSVVNALVWRSLPFYEPDRLALIHEFIPPHSSAREFHEWKGHSNYLADAAVFEEFDGNLNGTRIASRAHIAQTSSNFFSVLGVQPVMGTGFGADADVDGTGWGSPGSNAGAVIGYGLWQQLFGGNPNVLGTAVRVDGVQLRVVGVAPPGFDYPGKAVLWKPAAFSPGNNGWRAVARLRPEISWPQARAAFQMEVGRLSSKQEAVDRSNPPASITSFRDGILGPVKNASLIFMGAVTLVLLVACTNVSNLVMARTADRAVELTVRSALGATRARLCRQLLTESMVLSVVASLAGLAIAYWITLVAAKVVPPPLATQSYAIVDERVLVFTMALSIVTALAAGILPSLYGGRIYGFRSQTSRWSGDSRQAREILVGAQVMITMILLSASVCLGRAFVRLMKSDRGYSVNAVVTASVSLDGTTHQIDKRQRPYFEEVLGRIRNVAGIRSASATEFLPLYASAFIGGPFGLDGHAASRNSTLIPVLSGYFQTMGTQILCGREFTEAEVRSGAKVAVVNERFALGFGAPQDVLNHQLTNGNDQSRIVGVVRGMEYETDPTLANGNQVFIPSSTPGSFFSTFVVRVDGRPEDYLRSVQTTIQSVDPQVPVFGVKTMQQRLDEVFATAKFYQTAAWTFAGFALLLALIGIYGITSYAVAERTAEMGIRMALGSTALQLRAMLVRRGLLTVAAGALPGVVGAQLSGRLLESLMQSATPIGWTVSAGLIMLFAVATSVSTWLATHPIAALDVNSLLRSE